MTSYCYAEERSDSLDSDGLIKMKRTLNHCLLFTFSTLVLTKTQPPSKTPRLEGCRNTAGTKMIGNCKNGTFNCTTKRCECSPGVQASSCSLQKNSSKFTTPSLKTEIWTVPSTTTKLPFKIVIAASNNERCVNGRRVVKVDLRGHMTSPEAVRHYGETGATCDCSIEECVNYTKADLCRPNPCFKGKCYRSYLFDFNYKTILLADYSCLCDDQDLLRRKTALTKTCLLCPRNHWGVNCRPCGMCDESCHPDRGCLTCRSGWKKPPWCGEIISCLDPVINCHSGKCTKHRYHVLPGMQGWHAYASNEVTFCLCHDHFTGKDCSLYNSTVYHNVDACPLPNTCEITGGECLLLRSNNARQTTRVMSRHRFPTCFCPEGTYYSRTRGCVQGCEDSKATCMFGRCVANTTTGAKTCVCSRGYEGRNCSFSCSIGMGGRFRNNPRFGHKCRHECGRCFQLPCDPVTGSCAPYGCFPGWTSDRCLEPDIKEELWSKLVLSVNLKLSGAWSDVLQDETSKEYSIIRRTINSLNKETIRKMNFEQLQSLEDWQLNLISEGSIQVDYFVFFSPDSLKGVENFGSKFQATLTESGLEGWTYKVIPGSVQVRIIHRPPEQTDIEVELSKSDLNRKTIVIIVCAALLASVLVIVGFVVFSVRQQKKKKTMSQQWSKRRNNINLVDALNFQSSYR